jgi:glyoxylate/hydroxypyruvate reductase
MVDVVLLSPDDNPDRWRELLGRELPGLCLHAGADVPDPGKVDVALVWKPPLGALARFPNLRLIQGLGHGVDYLFDDPDLPVGVPIARLVDPEMIAQMSEYVCALALWRHRRFDDYAAQQRDSRWYKLAPTRVADTRVGVLGLGAIGADIAAKLRGLGFTVHGWSRSPKSLDGIVCHHGDSGLPDCLAASDILVCVLPLTPATRGILDAENLEKLPRGAYLINIARGAHQVEDDVLAALDSGRLSGAALDVFETEPLPPEHPFWLHPGVRLTPHVAGPTVPETAARLVADNIRRVLAGQAPLNRVDVERRY